MQLILIALIIILHLVNRSKQNKIIKYVILLLLALTIINLLSALLIGIGYYIDPSGWGENSVIANYLIITGNFLKQLIFWS